MTDSSRKYGLLDQSIMGLDLILTSIVNPDPVRERRSYPAESQSESVLSEQEQQHVAGLMRVNHAGEIAAQALYRAQALTARDNNLKEAMQRSAEEEIDHLKWCERRLNELNDHSSYLEPFWYAGSFSIGMLAGLFGDKWNLSFLAETEHQVVRHLDSHLAQLPKNDKRTRIILEQMREDELSHARKAEASGAKTLPKPIKYLMHLSSQTMAKTAYKI